ncbi:hypothetical protein HUG12_10060 [Halorarum salinum]|uniref:Uncharacterized protein n=1 Tax=Halorarum salinum TaxID=2743089 RepID=A0A7D5LAR7_9EURY|nr:hypothetical protein HUG12_10060 [Halobaculum salinum]
MGTTKYEDAIRTRFENFCDDHGFSRKYVATRGIEMFMNSYEANEDGEDTGRD